MPNPNFKIEGTTLTVCCEGNCITIDLPQPNVLPPSLLSTSASGSSLQPGGGDSSVVLYRMKEDTDRHLSLRMESTVEDVGRYALADFGEGERLPDRIAYNLTEGVNPTLATLLGASLLSLAEDLPIEFAPQEAATGRDDG